MSAIRVGTRIRLWPKDTFAKYGIVRSISATQVIVEITEMDPRDYSRYKIGDLVKLPAERLIVMGEQEYKDKYC